MAKSISPFLMFEGDAEAAMNLYVSLFPGSHIESIERFDEKGPGKAGSIMTAVAIINGQRLMFLDSPAKHGFTFTPSISLFAECETAAEVDALFTKLSDGGKVMMGLDTYPFANRFAWVSDKFGVSWQLRFT